jgi:hypothetical protein
MLALAAIDPEILMWTPGKKTIIEAPRYTFEQYYQWIEFERHKQMWLFAIRENPQWLEIQPDIYDRIAAGDRRAKELGIIL